MNWYHLGDRNTKFFYSCANQRRRKNNIKLLFDDQNKRLTSPEELEGAFKVFFEKLFTSSVPSSVDIDECLKNMELCVKRGMNEILSKTFTKVEIEDARSQMAPLKSSGLDGFGALFNKRTLAYNWR